MNIDQAKACLARFMGDQQHLTFSVENFEDGEWIARCNEISAIVTGGGVCSTDEMKEQIKDAILTAAGIDGVHSADLLRDTSITQTVQVTP